MDTIKIDNKNVKMVAHRGLSGIEKENTCSAFVAACNRATYFAVETDVHRTVDGQFVIFHDDNTARVGLDHLVIEESTFETLRKLQLVDIDGKRGRIDLTIPTLMEYIEICKKYGKHCVLELKNEFKASDVYKIVSMIEKAGYLDHVIFISFALKNLISLRRRYPTQPAQYLIKEWDDKLLDTLEKYNLGIDIYYKSATPDNVRKVHALGQEYNVWTVNEAVDFETLRKLQLVDIDGKRGRIDLTIPTLMEYIEICKKYGKHCVLELKNEFKASDVYKIVSMIEKAGYLDHVIFISFALKNLISLRRRYPTQPAQYLIKEWDDKLLDTLEKYNLGIDIYYKSATPDNVRKVHALGQEYNVWTVNEAVDGDAMVAMGVDYITTNILEGTNKAE